MWVNGTRINQQVPTGSRDKGVRLFAERNVYSIRCSTGASASSRLIALGSSVNGFDKLTF